MAITTAADKMTHTLTPVEARLLAEFSANEDDNCADSTPSDVAASTNTTYVEGSNRTD